MIPRLPCHRSQHSASSCARRRRVRLWRRPSLVSSTTAGCSTVAPLPPAASSRRGAPSVYPTCTAMYSPTTGASASSNTGSFSRYVLEHAVWRSALQSASHDSMRLVTSLETIHFSTTLQLAAVYKEKMCRLDILL